ncbi:MAG TPA: hypothetical protein VEA44_08955 [Caulobacter sp.]|nr:hypothetical protein [Caulobacter sp.]
MATVPEFEFGRTLLRAGGMWRRNLLKLGACILAISVIGLIVQGLLLLAAGGGAIPTAEREPAIAAVAAAGIGMIILGLISASLLSAVNAYAAEAEVKGEKATFAGGWKASWGNLLPQLGIQALLWLMLLVIYLACALLGRIFGILLFLGAATVFAVFFGLAASIQLNERRGVFASIGESVKAGEGNRWALFGYYLLAYLIAVIALLVSYFLLIMLLAIAAGTSSLALPTGQAADGILPFLLLFIPIYLFFSAAAPLALGSIPASAYVSLRKNRNEQAVSRIFE